jgi:DNA-binding CsgD family transcriptional regulator
MTRSAHRTWDAYVKHHRRKDAATKAHNTRVHRHIAIYEQICAKLEEWNDGLRLEELAVMLGEDELTVYRTLRWAQRAEWLVDEGDRGWRRGGGSAR